VLVQSTHKMVADMNTQSSALEQRLQRLQRYCELDADNIQLLRECVEVRYQLGDFDAARAQAQAALEKFPGDDLLQFQLATVEMASNHPDRTCDILQGLLARGIDNGNIRYNLAYALGLLGKSDEGAALLDAQWKEVCREVPSTPLLKGKLQHHGGDVAGAIETLRAYVDTRAADAEGNGYLALLLADAGDLDAATACAQHATASDSDQFDALLALAALGTVGGGSRIDHVTLLKPRLFVLGKVVRTFPAESRISSFMSPKM